MPGGVCSAQSEREKRPWMIAFSFSLILSRAPRSSSAHLPDHMPVARCWPWCLRGEPTRNGACRRAPRRAPKPAPRRDPGLPRRRCRAHDRAWPSLARSCHRPRLESARARPHRPCRERGRTRGSLFESPALRCREPRRARPRMPAARPIPGPTCSRPRRRRPSHRRGVEPARRSLVSGPVARRGRTCRYRRVADQGLRPSAHDRVLLGHRPPTSDCDGVHVSLTCVLPLANRRRPPSTPGDRSSRRDASRTRG